MKTFKKFLVATHQIEISQKFVHFDAFEFNSGKVQVGFLVFGHSVCECFVEEVDAFVEDIEHWVTHSSFEKFQDADGKNLF